MAKRKRPASNPRLRKRAAEIKLEDKSIPEPEMDDPGPMFEFLGDPAADARTLWPHRYVKKEANQHHLRFDSWAAPLLLCNLWNSYISIDDLFKNQWMSHGNCLGCFMIYQPRLGIMAAGCYGVPQVRFRVFLWGPLLSEVIKNDDMRDAMPYTRPPQTKFQQWIRSTNAGGMR